MAKKKLSSVLGIDIGSQKIKVCEIRSQGREPVVTALGMVDTPEGAVDHTGIYNPEAVAAAIKQALSESGAAVPSAIVTIAGQNSVLVRTLEVPRMNPSELRDHMQWEINRNIPFAESTVLSDFRALPDDDPGAPNMDVVMAISPQSAIDTMIQCIKKAGRSLAAIDVEPLSVARVVQSNYDDVLAARTFCVVDMGHKTTAINIYRGSKLLMPRQIPMGGEMFTRAIADSLTISVPEAEQLKIDKASIPENAADTFASPASPFGATGATQAFQPYNPFADEPTPGPTAAPFNPFADEPLPAASTPTEQLQAYNPFADEPAPVGAATGPSGGAPPVSSNVPAIAEDPEVTRLYGAIAAVLDEFVSEVRRSIDYFRSRGGDVNIVYLSGGGTKIKGLAPFLAKALGIECDALDPFRRLNLNVRKVAPEFVNEHRQEFAVAVGNGLHIFFD